MILVAGMQDMARKQKMIVAGNNGQKVLEFYNQTVDIVGKRWTIMPTIFKLENVSEIE